MSAAEIIEQIKALPREERAVVVEFVRQSAKSDEGQSSGVRYADEPAVGIRYASDEQARRAGDAVVAEFPETFRRLAE